MINSYFPVDQKTLNNDDLAELVITLQHIEEIIQKQQFSSFLLCGDINCDFLRNTNHVNKISDFISEKGLHTAWDSYEIDFTHIQENNNVVHTSTLDHFFWDQAFENQVIDAGVIHSFENSSDHCPVFCNVRIDACETKDVRNFSRPIRPNWKRSTEEEKTTFKNTLADKLDNISLPQSLLCCRDLHCKDSSHLQDCDLLISNVLSLVNDVAESTLHVPKLKSGVKGRKHIPNWSEQVKPYKEKAFFWSQVWKSAGSPINTVLHNVMKHSRNIYHYVLRKCKRSEETIKRSKILDSCINGDGNIFEEMKSLRRCPEVSSSTIDQAQGDEIPNHFRNIYKQLYNQHDDRKNMADLLKTTNDRICEFMICDIDKVTPQLVKEAACHLKNNKSDPVYSFSSDCIKQGPDKLFILLTLVLKSFLIHSHVSNYLLVATLVPIIKDKLGSISSSKNYRSIAISSQILKLLDWVVILLFGEKLGVDELQFAYQKGASTTMCTWAAVETINYFLRNGSHVYTCLMDMSKAFDVVRHSSLFQKIIKAGLPLTFVRLYMVIYINQSVNVRWNGQFSEFFPMGNGVKQGAVLSAIFYCIYMNDLFDHLRRSKYGCWLNGRYLGILGYSDDNFLLAPSLHALQQMLIICEKYAADHSLKFSTDGNPLKCKTKCIAFGNKTENLPAMKLCGDPLPWVTEGNHLGVRIRSKDKSLSTDILSKRAQYIAKNNELNQELAFCHPYTRFHMNEIYNTSFSGSPIWDLFCNEAKMMENTWNRSFRVMYNLPLSTHRYFVQEISGKMHLKNVLMLRFLGFLNQIRKSSKKITSHILSEILSDVRSTTGSNMRKIMLLTDRNCISDVEKDDVKNIQYAKVREEDRWKINIVNEIIETKAEQLYVDNMSQEELDDILWMLCTD